MNLTQISAATVFYGSVVALLIFALPSVIGAIKQAGIFRALAIFVLLGLLVIGFETLAVKTGLPYGKFSYGATLGRKLFGTTPWIIAITYPPILIGAFWLAKKMSIGFLIPLFTAIFTTLTYVILAPILTKLSIWHWENSGPFFGVPLRAYVGWFVGALIGAIIVKTIWGDAECKRLSAYSWFAITLFWAGANLGVGQLIPALVGIAISIVLFVLFITEKRRDKREA